MGARREQKLASLWRNSCGFFSEPDGFKTFFQRDTKRASCTGVHSRLFCKYYLRIKTNDALPASEMPRAKVPLCCQHAVFPASANSRYELFLHQF